MKTNYERGALASAALAVSLVAAALLPCRAEDYDLLKAKTELLVNQAKGLYEDSFRKGSETYGAPYQYYYGLMYNSGSNLLARTKSPANERLLRKYFDLVSKDYEAYTKVSAAADMAAATGNVRGRAGGRHRVKRMINAESLGDKELAAAVKRWESFVIQLKKQ